MIRLKPLPTSNTVHRRREPQSQHGASSSTQWRLDGHVDEIDEVRVSVPIKGRNLSRITRFGF